MKEGIRYVKHSRVYWSLCSAWYILLSIFVLVYPDDVRQGGYTNTPLYNYVFVLGFGIQPIEIFILLLAPAVFLVCFRRSSLQLFGGIRMAVLLAGIFSAAEITGALRLKHIVGMAEAKTLIITFTLMFLSAWIYERSPGAVLKGTSFLVVIGSLFQLTERIVDPVVDPVLGVKTHVTQAFVLYATLALTALILFRKYRRAPLIVAAAILGAITVLLCSSRISAIYMGLSAVFALSLRILQRRHYAASPARAHVIVFVGMTILGFTVAFAGSFFASHSALFRDFAFWQGDQETVRAVSNQAHLDDIFRGVILVGKSPIIGYGLGGSLPTFGAAVFTEVIHNEFLYFWVVMGIAGAALWLTVFVWLPIHLLRKVGTWKRDKDLRHPAALIVFLGLPYALGRAAVYPPFLFDAPGIWLVANMLALEALTLKIYANVPAKIANRARLANWFATMLKSEAEKS